MQPCTLISLHTSLEIFTLFSIGEFGVIYKAYLQRNANQNKETVAVKTLKGNNWMCGYGYGQGRGTALQDC